jgi:hypothetical protein
MNETEKDRILRMVSEGTLRPNEAAQLLAALTEPTAPKAVKAEPEKEPEKEKEKAKQQRTEIQMQRPDGSYYTFSVPPGLVPALLKVAGVEIKEAMKSAATDAWGGFKVMVRNKTREVTDNVTTRVRGGGKSEVKTSPASESTEQAEARRRIIQMVQNGRISATDASRLIEQLDALTEFRKNNPEAASP